MTIPVRRRDVLATLASASGATLAGCSERDEEPLQYACQDEPIEAASVEVGPKDWITPRGDAANTGVNTAIDPPQPVDENGYGRGEDLLKKAAGISDPVVGGGTVFVTGPERTWAFDGVSGGHYWSVSETGGQPILTESVLAYAIQDGIVVRETGTGCSRWETTVTGVSPSITAQEGTIYSVTGSALQAWAVEDGTERWSVSLPQATYPEISATESALFVTAEAQVQSFDHDGGRRWSVTVEPRPSSGHGPTITDDRVYLEPDGGGLIALDVADGTESWRVRAGEGWSGPPAATATDVYIADDGEGAVRKLAAEDGSERWSNGGFSVHELTAPSIVGDTLFVPGAGTFNLQACEQVGQFLRNGHSISFANDGIYYTSHGEPNVLNRLG